MPENIPALVLAMEFSGGLPLTTKGDNGYHGFGVKSIKSTIEKYGGVVVIDMSGGAEQLFFETF